MILKVIWPSDGFKNSLNSNEKIANHFVKGLFAYVGQC